MIGNEWRVETNSVRFAIKFSTNYEKMNKIWDTHSTYAMGEPYFECIDKYVSNFKYM